jgi:uncharacterized surface protein with fasciclin (FAS1) repeats
MIRKIALIALLTSALVLAGVCMAAEMNIMDTANATANLTEFVGAVETAGLTNTINAGTFTIFAPSDDAFSNILPEDYKALLENSTELKNVLTFHVVEGKIMLKDLKDGQKLTTVQGENLTIKVGSDKVVTVNGANITKADIVASNGVIHIIGTVLMPK